MLLIPELCVQSIDGASTGLPTYQLTAERVIIDRNQLDPVIELLENKLKLSSPVGDFVVQYKFSTIELCDGDPNEAITVPHKAKTESASTNTASTGLSNGQRPRAFTMTSAVGQLKRNGSDASIDFTFLRPDFESAKPVRFTMNTSGDEKPPTLRVIVDASETPLPCELLIECFAEHSPLISNLPPIAPGGLFNGRIEATCDAGLWDGNIKALITNLAVSHRTTFDYGYTLINQTGGLTVNATFCDNRLEKATGWIDLHDGWIGRTLLQRWSTRAKADTVMPLNPLEQTFKFDRFLVYYKIEDDQILVSPSEPDGRLLTGEGISVRLTGNDIPIPIPAAVSDLIPQSDDGIRLTDFSARLLECCR